MGTSILLHMLEAVLDHWRNPRTHCMEHGQRPEILCTTAVQVETRLDDIRESRKVATSVGKFNTLRLSSGSTGVCQCDDGFLIRSLALEALPALRAGFQIVIQPFEYRMIKWSRQFPLRGISVSIDNDGDLGMP